MTHTMRTTTESPGILYTGDADEVAYWLGETWIVSPANLVQAAWTEEEFAPKRDTPVAEEDKPLVLVNMVTWKTIVLRVGDFLRIPDGDPQKATLHTRECLVERKAVVLRRDQVEVE